MTWIHYASTDASAPVLSGTADSLNALLLACLVNGYGTQPGAGWTSPHYDTTSKTRVFQNANGFCAQIIDGGPGAGSFRESRIRGYESMSAHNVGVGPFPTVAQFANGEVIRKSATADATARVWDVYADSTFFLILVETGDAASQCLSAMFGRFAPDKSGDAWCQVIAARNVENSGNGGSADLLQVRTLAVSSVTTGICIVRDVTGAQATGSVVAGLRSDSTFVNVGISGSGGIAYPDPATGGLRLDRVYIHETNIPRGYIRGLWQPLHNRPLAHRAVETYIDGAVTRTLRAFNMATVGQILVEESDTVDSY